MDDALVQIVGLHKLIPCIVFKINNRNFCYIRSLLNYILVKEDFFSKEFDFHMEMTCARM